MFDLPRFMFYLKTQQEGYWAEIFTQLSKDNPGWIERLKADKDLISQDGKPVEVTQELVDTKVKGILEDPALVPPKITREMIYKFFLVDEKLLEQFIVE